MREFCDLSLSRRALKPSGHVVVSLLCAKFFLCQLVVDFRRHCTDTPSLKRATDACVLACNNASPAQRGPRPEGCSTAPRHAACGGPIPSSAEGPCVIAPSKTYGAAGTPVSPTNRASPVPSTASSGTWRPGHGTGQSPVLDVDHLPCVLERKHEGDCRVEALRLLRGITHQHAPSRNV